jgi:putative sigma-54 modulation protein
MKINVNPVKFKVDSKLDAFIREKIEKLSTLYDSIISGDVTLKLENTNTEDNKVVEVRLAIKGNDLYSKKQSKTFEEAIDNATDALKRQLHKHKEKINKL